MMSDQEEMEYRAESYVADNTVPCSNCGHTYSFHISPFGTKQPCDAEIERNIQTPGYAEMDVMCFCLCTEYEPEEN